MSDAYHTLYNLAGLNTAQNQFIYTEATPKRSNTLRSAFNWKAASVFVKGSDSMVFDEEDRLPPMHPIFIVPFNAAEEARAYFEARPVGDK